MKLRATRRILTVAAVVVVSSVAAPALAQDRDAVRAACMTYAEVKTDTAPSALPRMESPATSREPLSGGVQAPAARPTDRGVQAPAAGPQDRGVQAPAAGPHDRGVQAPGAAADSIADKTPEFQQAFNECTRKLDS